MLRRPSHLYANKLQKLTKEAAIMPRAEFGTRQGRFTLFDCFVMDNQYNYQADDRIRQHQAKVQEVVGIMKDNVNLVLERETRLAEIDTRADELQVQSKQFQSAASRVRRKYFWQNMKMWIIIGSLGVIILVVIIVWSVSNRNS
uniref:V-SNARE coiled-coil homology domain-containing protein n=2 Tax=Schistosoma japonicum TaxID=6182 RepID=Q86FE1_SCHJA|nr:similar to GenBank Accession Number AF035017 synaptobrevin in Xenopus laevis, vesicle-associated membrane protein 2 (VAMP-2) (Synaptobrevin 2) (SYBII) [Schistosoma japonicum]